MIHICYNKKAFGAISKELRRASWLASAISAVLVYQYGIGFIIAITVIIWTALQGLAFLMDSLCKGEK
jgi:hypothetical protein